MRYAWVQAKASAGTKLNADQEKKLAAIPALKASVASHEAALAAAQAAAGAAGVRLEK
jgi:hypothetical protein